jgi:hypothetical protein
VRAAALTAVAAAAVGGVAAFGEGNPSQDVRLLSGAAWLASSKVGQVTLLDGASAEVAAQVQVSPAGNLLEVVQQGSSAYAVDQTAGTVRRVDGATFAATEPQAPIADPTTEITAIPSATSLYTLDARRGILADTDPRTLRRRGNMVTVASKLTEGTATVDDSGTFWAIDPATGRVSRVKGDDPSYVDNVAKPGTSRLTLVNGHPVVVDQAGQKAVSLDKDTGQPGEPVPLGVQPDDKLQVSGSRHKERLYIVAQRGVLDVCELANGKCDKSIPLGADNDFGAAVETSDRLFLPNYSTGQVWIVDLARSAVIAKADILKASGRFQLLTRDGVVFYNDLNSEKAGVITLDGRVTPTAKYDPADPDKGLTEPVRDTPGQPNPQQQTPQQQTPRQPTPQQPTQQQPNQPQSPTQQPHQPEQPSQPESPQNPDSPRTEPQLKITMSDISPTVGQAIELKVENTAGRQPDRAQWTFGDGGTGEGLTTSHKWTAPGNPYQVTVKAFFDEGRQEVPAAIAVTVSAKQLHKLRVGVPEGGRITGNGINCPGTCEADLEPNTAVKLDATPNSGRTAGTWANCPGSTATTCQFVITGDRTNLGYTFGGPEQVRLTVRTPSNGTITGARGAINCPGGACTALFDKGTAVTLAAAGMPASFEIDAWGDACAGRTSEQCPLTLTAPETIVSVKFTLKPTFQVRVRSAKDPEGGTFGRGRIETEPGPGCALACELDITVHRDQKVTLTAAPTVGPSQDGLLTSFKRWEGGPCNGSTNKTCTFQATGNVTVTGIFSGHPVR